MISCNQEGGQDKKLRVWVVCEVCCYEKFIKHFSIMIQRYNSIEVCNKCWTKNEQKTSKVKLGNKIIKKLEPNKSDKQISELRHTKLYGLKKVGLEYLYKKLYKNKGGS
tara:strand:- start:251 stop:577 length:327 start_codon:yes stop_codon:yes gene_type:complete